MSGLAEDKTAIDRFKNGCAHESVIFLGQSYSPDEYQAVCQNLSDYFSILDKWAKRAKEDEKKSVQ